MRRREFFSTCAAAVVAGIASAPVASTMVRPPVDMDISRGGVAWALATLGWSSQATEIPALVVHTKAAEWVPGIVCGGPELRVIYSQDLPYEDARGSLTSMVVAPVRSALR